MTSCRLLSSCCFQIIGTISVESISATFLPIYLHLSIYWSACLCVETIPTIYDKYIYIYRLYIYISYSVILLGFFVQPSMWLHLNIHTCLQVQVGNETKNAFNIKQSIPPTVALAVRSQPLYFFFTWRTTRTLSGEQKQTSPCHVSDTKLCSSYQASRWIETMPQLTFLLGKEDKFLHWCNY